MCYVLQTQLLWLMQDIGDRYPEWLETNKDKLSPGARREPFTCGAPLCHLGLCECFSRMASNCGACHDHSRHAPHGPHLVPVQRTWSGTSSSWSTSAASASCTRPRPPTMRSWSTFCSRCAALICNHADFHAGGASAAVPLGNVGCMTWTALWIGMQGRRQ